MSTPPRSCRRSGCSRAATASLSFRYATGQVWLLDLSPAPHPSLYDLCAEHADTLTVPRGWQHVDERGATTLEQAPPRDPVDRQRYERLRAELPGVAARLAAQPRPKPAATRGRDPVDGRRTA